MLKKLQSARGWLRAGMRALKSRADILLHGPWLGIAWASTSRSRRPLTGLAVAMVALLLIPGMAQAQSSFCNAINAGALDHTATYTSGQLTATNARMTDGLITLHGIMTSASSHPIMGRWYNTSVKYPHTAGERVTINATIAGTGLSARLYRAESSTTLGGLVAGGDLRASGSITYTLTDTEYALESRAMGLSAANGTVTITASCAVPRPIISNITPVSGPIAGGASVTITGTDLANATVTVDGVALTPTANSDTSLTFIAPAHAAGAVSVALTTARGTATTTYTYLFPPTVTAVTPNSGATTGGATVTLTGTNFLNASAVSFGGAAAGYAVDSNTQITATSPANAAGTYDVTVTTPGGTSVTSESDQYTYVSAPTVTSISPTAGPAAGGTSVVITGTNFTGATAVTFGGGVGEQLDGRQWDPDHGDGAVWFRHGQRARHDGGRNQRDLGGEPVQL